MKWKRTSIRNTRKPFTTATAPAFVPPARTATCPKNGTTRWCARSRPSNELLHKALGTIDTPRKIRSQAPEAGAQCLAGHGRDRFARMPQLPRLRIHGFCRTGPSCSCAALGSAGCRQDLHRLPQGYRASFAGYARDRPHGCGG